MSSKPAEDPTTDAIRIRDEILEVLYWLKGEGIREEIGPRDLRPFVQLQPDEVREHLEVLAASGLLERGDGPSANGSDEGRYRLSERGSAEAGRRFVEAFAPILGQGHGTACAPGCECLDPTHPDESCPTHGSPAHRHR